MKLATAILSLIITSSSIVQSRVSKLPNAGNILIDGKIQASEWKNSKITQLSDSLTLYLKADKKYIYIAVFEDTEVQPK